MNKVKAVAGHWLGRPTARASDLIPLVMALCGVGFLVAPLVATGYQLFILTTVFIYAIAILGLNILTGFNGQISLGQGAFFALGAYSAGILLDAYAVPYWIAVPIAAAICFVAGFLFGRPALRLEGIYLGLATFALAVTTPHILKSHALEKWTGGVQGLVLQKPRAPWGAPLSEDQWLYCVCLVIAAVMLVVARNILRGRIGRAIVATRDNPTAAEAMGIDIAMIKSLTFGVSALYAGLAGSLAAISTQFISPDSFSVQLSISLLVGSVIGGTTSIFGALFGAAFIVFIPNVADQVSKAAPSAIFGSLLIIFVFLAPTGIAGVARRAFGGRSNK